LGVVANPCAAGAVASLVGGIDSVLQEPQRLDPKRTDIAAHSAIGDGRDD
jgi:hypothetical protein